MAKLCALVHITRQGTRHNPADAGAHTLKGAGGNQDGQAVSGYGDHRRYHENAHAHQNDRTTPDAIGQGTINQL
ncbi:Uncharacterised protein [Klebsiella pneumoniae]|nr:Uncharacterised protein [Klebsiella pneumoniae]